MTDNEGLSITPEAGTPNSIEMNRLVIPTNEDGLTTSGSGYGSTLSLGPEQSTANLLRIDLEQKINRHTGEDRELWDNRAQFILSLVGYAVGLGNVWRFPYLTQKNGGGAFLIPYAVMLAIEGIPLFFLELAIGQRLRKGAVGSWNQVSPYLAGIGIASAVVSFNVALYYNTIMSWCLLYLVQSFQSPLPWASCPHRIEGNSTIIVDPECEISGAPTYFWYRETLNTAPDVEYPSYLNWKMVVGLIGAWIIVYLCMIKGIKSSGKVVYFTATFPYFVLVIFFFRGITLRGFEKGIQHLFVPEWGKLMEPAVWLDAATQIFYSFGLAFGCLIALASYNPVRSNFLRDTLIVTVCDFFTSIFTATVVFSVLGFKATLAYEECVEKYGEHNSSVVNPQHSMQNDTICDFKKIIEESASGTGLAFIAFTEAINQFPVAPLWAIMFFLMLLTLGLDSMFGTLEGALTSLNDMMLFPHVRKEIVCGVVCLISCIFALCFATTTGPYVFSLFDSFCANIPLLIIALSECLAISYVYGLKQLSDDVELMLGSRPSYFWLVCWRYVAPVAMLLILAASLVEIFSNGVTYEAWDAEKGMSHRLFWPWWCQVFAVILILASVLWIPGIALCKYFGFIGINEETPSFFPIDVLKEERKIIPHKSTDFERIVLGFRD